MKHKKASLEMSMYAIVLVILAIIVIVLGLVFIRTIFKNIGTKVQEAVSAQEIVNPPTLDIPMTATPSSLELRKNEVKKSSIAFMNVLPDYAYCELSSRSTGGGPSLLHNGECMRMAEEQINIWTVIVAPDDATSAGTTIFTMIMDCYGSMDSSCSAFEPEATFTRDIVVTVRD